MRKLELFIYIGLMMVAANLLLFPKVKEVHRHDFVQETRFQVYMEEEQPKMHFAGEYLPLRSKKVMRRFEREMEIKGQYNLSTIHLFRRANRWLPQIRQMMERFDLPEDFQYVPIVESGLQNLVSPAGAAGFWQLMPETAVEFGLEVNDEVDERFHPMKSTWAACRYIKRSYRLLGNWTNVAAGYNLGINGLKRVMDHQAVESFYHLNTNKETSRYIYKLVAVKEIFEHPEEYGYKNPKQYDYTREPLRSVKVTESIADLDSLAKAEGINLRILRQFNPWLLGRSLTIKVKGDSYILHIPKNPERFLASPDTTSPAELDVITDRDSLPGDSVRIKVKSKVAHDSLSRPGNSIIHVADTLEKLSEIAEAYGVTVEELVRWNQLKGRKLSKGQKLVVRKPLRAKEENAANAREGERKVERKSKGPGSTGRPDGS